MSCLSIHVSPLLFSLHSLTSSAFPSFPPSIPSSVMTTPFPLPQPRGIDHSLPTCGESQCNGHGTCEIPPGGGSALVCNCELGYRGESCEETVNGALSLPLTLSVLGVIIGLVILAFIVAKVRQRQKKNRRY